MKNKILILIGAIILYIGFKHFVPFGRTILYPINLLVTFLHEFGHSFFAVITGGSVHGLQVNSDGSGYATIAGGWDWLVLMGGYIGSAVFGNMLLYVGLRKEKLAKIAVYTLSASLLFSAFWWYESVFTTILLILFAAGFILLGRLSHKFISTTLIIIGSASIIYIIEDFNIGPSSDLARFTEQFPLLPQIVWTVIWLIIVLVLTYFTVRRAILRSLKEKDTEAETETI